MALFQLGIRRTVLQIPRSLLICRQCKSLKLQKAGSSLAGLVERRDVLRLRPRGPATARSYSQAHSPMESLSDRLSSSPQAARHAPAPAEAGGSAGGPASTKSASSSFPKITTSRWVGYWLVGSAVSVFGIVVFGGLTRLTESGCVCGKTGLFYFSTP